MHPRLIDIDSGIRGMGHLTLDSYGTMVAVGFVIGAFLARRWARRNRIDTRLIIDFFIWSAILGVAGARLLHVVADGRFWDYVNLCIDPSRVEDRIDERECRALNNIWNEAKQVCHPKERDCLAWLTGSGGLAFYGGFIAVALFFIYFVRKYRLPAGKLMDALSCLLMLGLAWGRMGCFLGSCCFGARTDSFTAVSFPGGSAASRAHWHQGWLESYRMESLPVHPPQLYEAVFSLALAALTYLWLMPRKRFDGQVFCVASGLYASCRFLVEFIRRDARGGLFGLSTSQLIALAFLAACGFLWRHFGKRTHDIIGAG